MEGGEKVKDSMSKVAFRVAYSLLALGMLVMALGAGRKW